MTRHEAKEAGLNRYLGKSCPYGHDGERYTRNDTCVTCQRIRAKARNDRKRHDRDPVMMTYLARRNVARKERNPGRYRANTKVNTAIRDGRLIPCPCVSCGTTEGVEAHHPDITYQLENDLDVMWLCQKHHHAWHTAFGPGGPIVGMANSLNPPFMGSM